MTFVITFGALVGVAGFTVFCWLVAELLMKLCGKDPRI